MGHFELEKCACVRLFRLFDGLELERGREFLSSELNRVYSSFSTSIIFLKTPILLAPNTRTSNEDLEKSQQACAKFMPGLV